MRPPNKELRCQLVQYFLDSCTHECSFDDVDSLSQRISGRTPREILVAISRASVYAQDSAITVQNLDDAFDTVKVISPLNFFLFNGKMLIKCLGL